MTFPLMFVPELLPGAFFPFIAAMAFAAKMDLGAVETSGLAAAFLALWFGVEAVLARAAGWHWSIRMALACVLRDILLPLLWVDAWLGSSFTWRGTEMRPREAIETSR